MSRKLVELSGDGSGLTTHFSSQLRVLTCSANLGNEKPDDDSLAAWIPADGNVADVMCVSPQKYPIRRVKKDGRFEAQGFSTDACAAATAGDLEATETPNRQFDLIVLGLQESTFDPPEDLTENALEEFILSIPTVTPVKKAITTVASGVASLTANVDHTKKKTMLLKIKASEWSGGTAVFHQQLEARLPSYDHVVSFQRGEMRLEIFARVGGFETIRHLDVLNVAAQNTGLAGLANKGGIVAELLVNGHTRLGFLTAHLEAHEGRQKYNIRCQTVGDILSGTRSELNDVSLTSHFCFAMGDLNFRTDMVATGQAEVSGFHDEYKTATNDEKPEEGGMDAEEHKAAVRALVAKRDWDALNKADELHSALRNKHCLVGFQTLVCDFPPTFKMERKKGYDYVEKRRPSYTDRVLWKTGHGLDEKIIPIVYEPIDNFASSDHKPVRAAFKVDLNDSFKMRPQVRHWRSGLFRSMSLMNVKSRSKHKPSRNTRHNSDRLQLFVSGLRVEIYDDANVYTKTQDNPPNPYVVLVSSPESALRRKVSKWNRTKNKLLFRTVSTIKDAEGSMRITKRGWPRTSRMMQTFAPDWEDEEITCQVQTHALNGASLDLTGAILHLSILDYRPSVQDDELLGTFSFNLVDLLRSAKNPNMCSVNLNKSRRMSTGVHESTGSRKNIFRSRTMEHMSGLSISGDLSRSTSEDPIALAELRNEPLLRFGRETGRITCNIEAWWMDEATAKALSAATMEQPHSSAMGFLRGSGRSDGNGSNPFLPTQRQQQDSLRRSRGAIYQKRPELKPHKAT